jgi:hypothetical protein
MTTKQTKDLTDMKKFTVTAIVFDFEDDDFECPPDQQTDYTDHCCNYVDYWLAKDLDDLVEVLTNHYGFLVKYIDAKEVFRPD